MSVSTRSIRPLALVLAAIVILSALAASPAGAENKKHHITLSLGYVKHLSDDLKDDALGTDLTNAGYGSLAYRLSLARNLDLTLDSRSTIAWDETGGVDWTMTTGWFGPGIRLIAPREGVRPYAQVNFFLVSEELEAESGGVSISADENGIGFGVTAGVDIRAGNLLSIPVEAVFLYGDPEFDVTGIGASVGLTFNFGTLN